MGEDGINWVERWYGVDTRNKQAEHERVSWKPSPHRKAICYQRGEGKNSHVGEAISLITL